MQVVPILQMSSESPGDIFLNVGAGSTRINLPGWINCDSLPHYKPDMIFDLEKTWPFKDNTISEIYASHVLEHLVDYRTFFREAWRVLKPNCLLQIRVPYGGHRSAWWDMEHKRPWFAENFSFLQPNYGRTIGNPEHADWKATFVVLDSAQRISAQLVPYLRWGFIRRWLVPKLNLLNNVVEELWVTCAATKTPEDVAQYVRQDYAPNAVPCRYVVYRHHWEVGDLIMWDNRCTLHRGRRYDLDQERELRRSTTGDEPFVVEGVAHEAEYRLRGIKRGTRN